MVERPDQATASRWIWILVAVVAVTSAVHYTDNVLRYDHYLSDHPSFLATLVPAPVVGAGWFVFTGFGLWGAREFARAHRSRAAIGLAVCSIGGLFSLLHFTEVSPANLDTFQLVGITVEIVLGVVVAGTAAWVYWRAP